MTRPAMRVTALPLALGMLLAGCSSPKSASGGPELTMWLVGSEAQARTINQLAQPFTEQTGIAVHCEAVAWGEAHSKYLTAVAGGVQPDIGTMGLTWGGEFGRLGALVALQSAYPQDVAAIQRATFPGLWESVAEGGQVYGIPFDLTLQMLYYRTDIVPTPPTTWGELTALLDRLRQDNRRMIIDWGSLSWIGYAPFLWQAGGDFYAADRSASTLESRPALQALEFFRDLYTRYDVPRTSIPVEQGLRTGDFPLAISGNWKIVSLEAGVPEIAGRWAVAALPQGPSGRRTAFLGGRIVGIFEKSPHRDAAWQFVQYLFRPDVQLKLYEAAGETQDAYLPPNTASWDALPMEAGMKAVLKQQAQDAKGPPAIPGWNEVTHDLEAAIQRTVLHEADPRTELAQVTETMTRVLRTHR